MRALSFLVNKSESTVLLVSVGRTRFAICVVLANEARVWWKQSKPTDALDAWKEIRNWPFANAKLEPLPHLTAGTCQPMVKALALLREKEPDVTHNATEDEKEAELTASLLQEPGKAESLELCTT